MRETEKKKLLLSLSHLPRLEKDGKKKRDGAVFEAKITIEEGASAGLVFRASADHLARYEFTTSPLGSYVLDWFAPTSGSKVLSTGQSPSIKTSIGQTNLVAIVASNQRLFAYVNGQQVASVQDSTFLSAGHIGLIAYPAYDHTRSENDAVVTANEVRLWKL